MKQPIEQMNLLDADGNPTGGYAHGLGFEIAWQNGPLKRGDKKLEQNGAFIESVLDVVVRRLQFFQSSKFACRENAIALTHIETANLWLQKRTQEREARGVAGTHQK